MKFTFHNLGALDFGELELNDLTIICGKNNTGKTYLTYALYGFLKNWEYFFDIKLQPSVLVTLSEKGSVEIDLEKLYFQKTESLLSDATKKYKEQLSHVLAAQKGRFDNTEIDCILDLKKNVFSVDFEREFKSEKGNKIISLNKKKNSSILVISSIITGDFKADFIPKRLIEDSIKAIVWGRLLPNPFIVSTERTGAIMFRDELNLTKNRLIDYAHQVKADSKSAIFSPMEFLNAVFDTGYPMPVKDNVNFTNGLNKLENQKSELLAEYPDLAKNLEKVLGGSYKFTKDGGINFIVQSTKIRLKMGESSSAIRSLLILSSYIKHSAKVGDFLIIDEPELNLHPSNQRKVARLIACLVNAGVKILITTHSDYFIKEFNSLIMLNSKEEGVTKIQKEYGYQESEILKSSKVSLYTIKEGEMYLPKGNKRKKRGTVLVKANIDPLLGIEAKSFDEEINEMNEIQNKLYNLLIE
jgi:predicted ATP-dependent endonuclease of OLD family